MSDSFGVDWLNLREPFDHAARDLEGATALPRPSSGQPKRIVDLGCGTGSNLRALALRLGGRQHWRMVDHDPALLAAMPGVVAAWAGEQGLRVRDMTNGMLTIEGNDDLRIEVEPHCADMARDLDAIPFADADLVTASALLDLASAAWIDALVDRCRAANATIWWALSVDGRVAWTPSDPDDQWMLAQFDAHQQRDKGFGPALGAGAAAHAFASLERAGYRVTRARSDWQVDAQRSGADQDMLRAMVHGMGAAVAEQAPGMTQRVAQWQRAKSAQAAVLRLRVGHVDLLGVIA